MDNITTDFSQNAADDLGDSWYRDDPWDYDPQEIAPLQLAALRARFAERRQQLKVLDQRATDAGIAEIATLDDAVPLLFSHTTYKSYPASFLEKGRWDMMTKWLGTLSTQPMGNVDVAGVTSVDEWIAALHRAGHLVVTSSGTTGLTSYINRTEEDGAVQRQVFVKLTEVSSGQKEEKRFPYFWGGPDKGWNQGGMTQRLVRAIYGRPDACFTISKHDVSVAELDRLAMTRKAIADGTATPGMIADAQRSSQERMTAVEQDMQSFFDNLFAHRHEDVYVFAGASTLWRIVEAGRARGLADGAFTPGSIILTGGGMKGFRGPTTYREDAIKFFGIAPSHMVIVYGMAEMNSQFLYCSEQRYHCPPTTVLLLLDKSGETLVNQPSGIVEGRGGFFDTTLRGRWGGVISGDKLTMDFSPCKCGRKSPSVVGIARYKDLPEGDDKLTCAGQIDTYIRGIAAGED